MGKLIRQVEYGICYRYVKYGGKIFVRFVCKIKDLSGVVVFSINNSSLIGSNSGQILTSTLKGPTI